jgi:hypothetical protein
MKPLIPSDSPSSRTNARLSLIRIALALFFLPWLSLTLLPSSSRAADDERLKAIRRATPEAGASASGQRRVALVIGNADYKVGQLRNPVNDAEDIAKTLREIGFTVFTKVNADQREMEEAVDDFARKIQDGDIALFYFSGHGVQVRGENFLIPVGPSFTTESDVRFKAVNVGYILSK